MRTTRGPWWPTVVLTLSVLGIVVSDLMTLATWRAGYDHPYEFWREGTLGPLAYGVVGWIIAVRIPGNRLGPLMISLTAASALQGLAGNLAGIGFERGWSTQLVAVLAGAFRSVQTVSGGIIIAVLLIVPTGRTLSRFFHWTLVVLVVSVGLAAFAEFFIGTTSSELAVVPPGASLASSQTLPLLQALDGMSSTGWLLALLIAMVGLVVRWRRSDTETRRQVTWVALGGLAGPLLVLTLLVIPRSWPWWTHDGSADFAIAGAMLPLGIAVAVLRHGLYELDNLVSRTVSYAIVTGVVVAIYAVLVTGISQLVQGADNLAVAAATLAAAASVRPLLRRVRNRVDRQFNRTRFDAEQAVHEFGTTLRTVVDPDHVATELRGVLVRTVQPAGLAIWLRASS